MIYKYIKGGFCICLGILLTLSSFTACSFTRQKDPEAAIRFILENKKTGTGTSYTIDPLAETIGDGRLNHKLPKDKIHLDLNQAINFALQTNKEIRVAAYNPLQANEELIKNKSVYDLATFASWNMSNTERPVQSQLDTGVVSDEEFAEERWAVKLGLTRRIGSGGTISVYQEVDSLESSSSYIDPNPQNTSRVKGELVQPILKGFGDKEVQYQIAIARTEINSSNQDYRAKVVNVLSDVINTYWRVVYDQHLVLISQGSMTMAEEIFRKEKVRLSQGMSKSLEVNRVIYSIESRRSNLLKAQNRLENSKNKLRLLINPSSLLALSKANFEVNPIEQLKAVHFELSSEEIMDHALKYRPELLFSQETLHKAQMKKELADHMQLPKFDVKLSYALNSLAEDAGEAIDEAYNSDKESWAVLFEFEAPLSNRGPKAEFRKTILEFNQARDDLLRVTEQIRYEVEETITNVTLAVGEIESALRAKEAARRLVESEKARYELGQTANSELLRSQETLADAERDYIGALFTYNIAVASLRRAEGTLLDEYHIRIE